jgi:DNA helicase HerA-like ATPase
MENIILDYEVDETIGVINSVDTGTATASITKDEELSKLQVNQLLAIKSPHPGRHLIGMIIKIFRKAISESKDLEDFDHEGGEISIASNQIRIVFVGEFIDKLGTKNNVFRRNVTAVPSIDAACFKIEGKRLSDLMKTISSEAAGVDKPLIVGKYTMDENSIAYLDGDKLFQRHAAIVGSTGSGKSYCVAKLVEQMADLPNANAILFDIHGEYSTESFAKEGIKHYKIATPSDLKTENKLVNGILMIPYWLLTYEEMQALLLDRSDQNAPNQAMLLSREVLSSKEKKVKETEYDGKITLDSPIPYDLNTVLDELIRLDEERIQGSRGEKDGPFHGKLTRFNQRLKNKLDDKRMGFMFSLTSEEMSKDWLDNFLSSVMGISTESKNRIKVIDFSEVPSDVLPLVIGLVVRLVFSAQQWSEDSSRQPIALLCDEAHLYVQQMEDQDSVAEIGLKSFERIAKEGRKYGVGLVIISQRPSEVNRTVLSQCNNFISLRLTNVEDQNVIKRLLPDNLGNIADNLSLLDVGEAIVVGDAILLPSRIKVDTPSITPSSQTVPFWKIWSREENTQDLKAAVRNMIKQSKS